MSQQPISEANSPQNQPTSDTPRWETWTMALSFVALWAWFIAHQSAARAGQPLSLLWQIPLLVSVGLLIWIFVRRMKRAMSGIKAVNPARRGRPGRN